MPDWKKAFYSIIDVVKKDRYAKQIAHHLAQNTLYEYEGVDALYSKIKDKYMLLQTKMNKLGMPIKLSEGFRSAKKQNEYYAKGRTTEGKIITNAQGLQSYHNFGLAFDVIFIKYNWNAPQNWWDTLGKEGEKLGLTWGGRWEMRDYTHFELHDGFTWKDVEPYLRK